MIQRVRILKVSFWHLGDSAHDTVLCEGFPGGPVVKNLPAKQEMQVQSLGQKDPLEKEMAPTSVFLPGKSPGQRSPAGYSP